MSNFKYYDLVRRPIITEKSTMLSEQNKYIFEVIASTEKHAVKKAVEKIFEVKVQNVNIINTKGKIKRFKGRLGVRSDFKKAIVTLEPSFSIDLTGGSI